MPNHVTNRLKIVGTEEQVEKVLDFIKAEKLDENDEVYGRGTIDFNKITPMPNWVYGSDPSVMGIGMQDEMKYGKDNTVLGWSRKHWGTKWNAYGLNAEVHDGNTIYFETAWNGVPELIQKIAWIFPDVTVEYAYADEDFGQNVAEYHFKDTDTLHEHVPFGGTKEAYELALEVTGSTAEERHLVYNPEIGNYEWKDDEEDY